MVLGESTCVFLSVAEGNPFSVPSYKSQSERQDWGALLTAELQDKAKQEAARLAIATYCAQGPTVVSSISFHHPHTYNPI